MTTLVGALVVAAAGLIVGSGGWPMKLMRQLQFEHWWFVGMLVGLIVMPWAVTQSLCPDALNALGSVDASVLIRSNLFALGWGVLGRNLKEVGLAAVIGVNFSIGVAMMGQGMLLLGTLGASVGFGIQQSTQMLGNQGVGFISGEWRGVSGAPRHQWLPRSGCLCSPPRSWLTAIP